MQINRIFSPRFLTEIPFVLGCVEMSLEAAAQQLFDVKNKVWLLSSTWPSEINSQLYREKKGSKARSSRLAPSHTWDSQVKPRA